MGGRLNPMSLHSTLGTSFWFQRVIVRPLLTILTEGGENGSPWLAGVCHISKMCCLLNITVLLVKSEIVRLLFIYFYFHPIDHYKMIMYMSGDCNTNNNT